MYNLGIRREFRAKHYLIGGDWGEENLEHGHNYQLEIVLEKAQLDRHGFLVDIVEVERHLDEIIAMFVGKTLNGLPVFSGLNPSIERLATVMHGLFSERFINFDLDALKVSIWEDEIAWTSYRAEL